MIERKVPAMTKVTRRNITRGAALGLVRAIAAPALAQSGKWRWRMSTSWPKRLPGPGMSAERGAERIATRSGGRRESTVAAAGEVVPALEVLDAVGSGVAEIGHTAAFYWQGKAPAAAFFTTVPFGLIPNEHVSWIEAGGGQVLWDELYAPFGVKPFMGGNTGVCMGGWFRREIKSRDDVRGLKVRSLGLGGEVYRRLGAIAQTTSPGEIQVALQSGVIDGAEFVGPGSDIALGLYRFAPFYYGPGFNKPNVTSVCSVSVSSWNVREADLKAIVAHSCAAEAKLALADAERLNPEALVALTGQHRVQLRAFPQDLIRAARGISAEVLADLSALEGRQTMVAGVERIAGGVLDGLVAAAGIAAHDDEGVVVAINYFGAVATLAGLRPLLARGNAPSAVALSSNSTSTQPGVPLELTEACLSDDEAAARALAATWHERAGDDLIGDVDDSFTWDGEPDVLDRLSSRRAGLLEGGHAHHRSVERHQGSPGVAGVDGVVGQVLVHLAVGQVTLFLARIEQGLQALVELLAPVALLRLAEDQWAIVALREGQQFQQLLQLRLQVLVPLRP